MSEAGAGEDLFPGPSGNIATCDHDAWLDHVFVSPAVHALLQRRAVVDLNMDGSGTSW